MKYRDVDILEAAKASLRDDKDYFKVERMVAPDSIRVIGEGIDKKGVKNTLENFSSTPGEELTREESDKVWNGLDDIDRKVCAASISPDLMQAIKDEIKQLFEWLAAKKIKRYPARNGLESSLGGMIHAFATSRECYLVDGFFSDEELSQNDDIARVFLHLILARIGAKDDTREIEAKVFGEEKGLLKEALEKYSLRSRDLAEKEDKTAGAVKTGDIMGPHGDEILKGLIEDIPEDTREHTERVWRIAKLIASEVTKKHRMNDYPAFISLLRKAVYLHDIGAREKFKYPDALGRINAGIHAPQKERVEPTQKCLNIWGSQFLETVKNKPAGTDAEKAEAAIQVREIKEAEQDRNAGKYFPTYKLYIKYIVLGKQPSENLTEDEEKVAENFFSHGAESIRMIAEKGVSLPEHLEVLIRWHHDYNAIVKGLRDLKMDYDSREDVRLVGIILILSDIVEQGNNHKRLVEQKKTGRVEDFGELFDRRKNKDGAPNGYIWKRFEYFENIAAVTPDGKYERDKANRLVYDTRAIEALKNLMVREIGEDGSIVMDNGFAAVIREARGPAGEPEDWLNKGDWEEMERILSERAKNEASDLEKFADVVKEWKNAGRSFLWFSDLDATMTDSHKPVSEQNIRALIEILETGTPYVVISGISKERLNDQFINPLLKYLPSEKRGLLRDLVVASDNGTQEYECDPGKNEFVCVSDIEKVGIKANIGEKEYEKVIEIVKKAMDEDGFKDDEGRSCRKIIEEIGDKQIIKEIEEDWEKFKKNCVDERIAVVNGVEDTTQITLMFMGKKASSGQKNKFGEMSGKGFRQAFKEHILAEFEKAGISGLRAKVSGASSIDITLKGAGEKGDAIRRIFERRSRGQGFSRESIKIFSGDSFDKGHNDESAISAAKLIINVGHKFDKDMSDYVREDVLVQSLEGAGPRGWREFAKVFTREMREVSIGLPASLCEYLGEEGAKDLGSLGVRIIRVDDGDKEKMMADLSAAAGRTREIAALIDPGVMNIAAGKGHKETLNELKALISDFSKRAREDITRLMDPTDSPLNSKNSRALSKNLQYVEDEEKSGKIMAVMVVDRQRAPYSRQLSEKSIYDVRMEDIYRLNNKEYSDDLVRYLGGPIKDKSVKNERYLITAVDKAFDLSMLARAIEDRRAKGGIGTADEDPGKDFVIIRNDMIKEKVDTVLAETGLGALFGTERVIFVDEGNDITPERVIEEISKRTGKTVERSQIVIGDKAESPIIRVDPNDPGDIFQGEDGGLMVRLKKGLVSQLYRVMLEIMANNGEAPEWESGIEQARIGGVPYKFFTYLPKIIAIDLKAEEENYERYVREVLKKA